MIEDNINEKRLNKVPELPIIPAFLILVEFGFTIIMSPEKT